MSLASTVSLGALRIQAQQRADLENSQAVSVPEWNGYISQSYKRLFNMLVSAYGNDYYVAFPGSGTSPLFQFTLTGAQLYPLPDGTIVSLGQSTPAPALFKLLGVDLQCSGSATGWLPIGRFEEIERGRYSNASLQSADAFSARRAKYRMSGNQLKFNYPISGVAQLNYIPQPTPLLFIPTCATTLESLVVTTRDASDISVGMSVYGSGIQDGTTVSAVNTTVTPNTITLSQVVLENSTIVSLLFWTDAVTIDGIAGWEEYVIIDSAIKAKIKQEEDITDLKRERDGDGDGFMGIVGEIKALAEGRDAGQAHHVSDALALNGGYDDGGCGDGWGGL